MGQAKITAESFIAAVDGSGGIKHAIAKRLGVHRNSIDNYLRRWPSARAAFDAEVEGMGDLAESVVITNIQLVHQMQKATKVPQDVSDAKWYCRMRLKNRGYVERQEVTGAADGEPIRFVVVQPPAESDGE